MIIYIFLRVTVKDLNSVLVAIDNLVKIQKLF